MYILILSSKMLLVLGMKALLKSGETIAPCLDQGEYMANYVQRCGNISRLFSLGTTPNGNELWALELSAAPGKIEAKPNFKYLANMHGDEPVGRCLSVLMSDCCSWPLLSHPASTFSFLVWHACNAGICILAKVRSIQNAQCMVSIYSKPCRDSSKLFASHSLCSAAFAAPGTVSRHEALGSCQQANRPLQAHSIDSPSLDCICETICSACSTILPYPS